MKEGSAPNFAPPVEEGITIALVDENEDQIDLEFLGILTYEEGNYAFFYPMNLEEDNGEVVVLEVVSFDEEGQAAEFKAVEDDALVGVIFEEFKEAAKDLYEFA